MEIVQAFTDNFDCKSDAPLKINNCGYYKDIAWEIFTGHGYYKDYMMIYVYRGQLDVIFDGQKQTVHSGNIVIVPPLTQISFTYYPATDSRYFWCHFTGTLSAEVMHSLMKKHGQVIAVGRNSSIARIFESIMHSYRNEALSGEDMKNSLLLDLFYTITGKFDNGCLKDYENVVSIWKTAVYIQQNFQRNITIDELSQMCNMSRFYFMKKFKLITGMPAHQYILNARLNKATELLSERRGSIKDVAYSVGFYDCMYFSKAFRQFTGMTPTKYRSLQQREATN